MTLDPDKLIKELNIKINQWREAQDDPHQISNAVLVALEEVRSAIIEATHDN